jgi:hypothetical protein
MLELEKEAPSVISRTTKSEIIRAPNIDFSIFRDDGKSNQPFFPIYLSLLHCPSMLLMLNCNSIITSLEYQMEQQIDPVAEAEVLVTTAQQTLLSLDAKRVDAVAASLAAKATRKRHSYASHAKSDPASQKAVEQAHDEILRADSHLQSIDDAIAESKRRLSDAQSNLALEKQKAKAREGVARLEELTSLCHGADSALSQYVQTVEQMDRYVQSLSAVSGGRPSRQLLRLALKRSLFFHLIPLRNIVGPDLPVATLSPNDRKPLAHFGDAWDRVIRGSLEAIIAGKPVELEPDEEAA